MEAPLIFGVLLYFSMDTYGSLDPTGAKTPSFIPLKTLDIDKFNVTNPDTIAVLKYLVHISNNWDAPPIMQHAVLMACDPENDTDIVNMTTVALECGLSYYVSAQLVMNYFRNSISLHYYWNLLQAYTIFIEEGVKLLDMNGFEANHELRDSFSHAEKHLKLSVENLQNSALETCIKYVAEDESEDAVNVFRLIGNDSLLSFVVEKAYVSEDGDRQSYQKVLYFITGFNNCSVETVGFPVLFKVIRENNDTNSYEMIIFSRLLDKCMNATSLKTEVDVIATNIVNTWALEVRVLGHKTGVYGIAKRHKWDFRYYVGKLVEKAYGKNRKNAMNILRFINNLPYIEQEVVAYPALFDAMVNHAGFVDREILTLAWRAHDRARTPGNGNSVAELRNIFRIDPMMPTGIRSLLYDTVIYIGNKALNSTYLGYRRRTTAQVNKTDESIYEILSCPPETPNFESSWSKDVLGGAVYFKFMNVESESFYGRDNEIVSHEDGSISDVPGLTVFQHHWLALPVENGEYFRFQNGGTKKFLRVDTDLIDKCALVKGIDQSLVNSEGDAALWTVT